MSYFATTAKGIEDVLAGELFALGAKDVRAQAGGVAFAGDDALMMRACLWLRTANRVLVPLLEFPCATEKDLYEGVRALPWHERLLPDMTLAVDANVRDSVLTHSRYAALKTKDAIVDQIRDRLGARPSVDVAAPDVRVNVRLFRNRATVSLDASGGSLHERGYRVAGGEAPLKETLAAALVMLSGWRPGMPLCNPMCGTGTIAIEAALMAADAAPGLRRDRFGFSRWRGFDQAGWRRIQQEARARLRVPSEPVAFASDRDARMVEATRKNARAAGVERAVRVERADVRDVRPPAKTGIVLVNPPYGERLGDERELAPLYAALGDLWKRHFGGWTAYLFTGNPRLVKSVGLRTSRRIALYNGPIECRLLRYELYPLKRASPR